MTARVRPLNKRIDYYGERDKIVDNLMKRDYRVI